MASPVWDSVPLSEAQSLIRREIRRICAEFDREYWREKEANESYPHEFADTLAEHGWLGALIPEEYGGAGLDTEEVLVVMEEIAASPAGLGGAQAIHGAIYTSTPLVEYGSEAQKRELLPKLATGELSVQSLGLTEPNAGSESTAIETTAERDGDEFVVDGQKIWISRVDVSDYVLLVARTRPRAESDGSVDGISMFLVDLAEAEAQGAITKEPIEKSALNLSHSFELWFDGLRLPEDSLVGTEHEGFYQLLDGLNDERLVVAAECVGHGKLAVERATAYANEREVFDRPIGQNQAIQHPIADAYTRVQAAKQLTYAAASASEDLDQKQVGTLANSAKYLAAEAAYEASDAAVQTHGGFGVAREYDVERLFRDARLIRIAPVSQELALSYVAETGLGLPRSY